MNDNLEQLSIQSSIAGLQEAIRDLHSLVGALAADHAATQRRVEEHARRLAARALIASLPETAAILVLGLLASHHVVSGELAVTAVLGVLGFRLAPGRLQNPNQNAPPSTPPSP